MPLSTMDGYSPTEQYFELMLDLPERKRNALLAKLDAEEPEVARQLRGMLGQLVGNPDFACQPGTGGASTKRAPRALDAIDHVAVEVADVDRAVEWYAERFRCRVAYRDATWAMLEFGNVRLALMAPGQHPPHVAVSRSDAAAFGPLKTHRDGLRYVYLTDPFGNTVEVLEPPADDA